MVKDHSDSERGNLLPPRRLLFPISSKGAYSGLVVVLRCEPSTYEPTGQRFSQCTAWASGARVCPRRDGVYLEVSSLGDEPVVDELLWVPGVAEEELAVGLQLIDRLDGLVNLQYKHTHTYNQSSFHNLCFMQIHFPWTLIKKGKYIIFGS